MSSDIPNLYVSYLKEIAAFIDKTSEDGRILESAITKISPNNFPPAFARAAASELIAKNYLKNTVIKNQPSSYIAKLDPSLETIQISYLELTHKGVLLVYEKKFSINDNGLIDNSDSLSDDQIIPASDRFVTLNHNSGDYQAAIDALTEIGSKIDGANDTGIDTDERKSIGQEIRALAEGLSQRVVRLARYADAISPRGFLHWLGEKLAGHALEATLKAALAALKSLFG
jgi:hypothetical protein